MTTDPKFHLSDSTRRRLTLVWLYHRLALAKRRGDTARVKRLQAKLKRLEDAA